MSRVTSSTLARASGVSGRACSRAAATRPADGETLAQRHDRRHRAARAPPRGKALDFIGDDGLGAADLDDRLRFSARRPGDRRRCRGTPARSRRPTPRHRAARNVMKSGCLRRLTASTSAREDGTRRAGGGDDDVGSASAERRWQESPAPDLACERLCVRGRAARDRSRRRLGCAGAGVSAADPPAPTTSTPPEPAEILRASATAAKPSRPRPRRPVSARTPCPRRTTCGRAASPPAPRTGAWPPLEGVLHLAENLRLADDQRVEAGRHGNRCWDAASSVCTKT